MSGSALAACNRDRRQPSAGDAPIPRARNRSLQFRNMTGAIRIRPAAARESERLTGLAIRSKAHWGYSPEFMRACRAELSVSPEAITHPRFEYLVAESGGGIVGFCALARLSVEEYELEALFVEPPHIGRGVGPALIEAAQGACAGVRGAVDPDPGRPECDPLLPGRRRDPGR